MNVGLQDSVKECYTDMEEVVVESCYRRFSVKRKALSVSEPQSPVGVLEAAAFSSSVSEGTLGFSSRESSPGCGEVFPIITSSQSKRRKLLADDQSSGMRWQ